ncbi:hypothetical protein WJX72_003021 [[Myrmecia] bisecta]|uniref:NB-ARC domain-containing protein n=1 Tax=[Myrmecia] bisecta TaxID=41462 RepID=A0AAW1PAP1_9CHLO
MDQGRFLYLPVFMWSTAGQVREAALNEAGARFADKVTSRAGIRHAGEVIQQMDKTVDLTISQICKEIANLLKPAPKDVAPTGATVPTTRLGMGVWNPAEAGLADEIVMEVPRQSSYFRHLGEADPTLTAPWARAPDLAGSTVNALRSTERARIALWGMPGSGKTELACHIARLSLEQRTGPGYWRDVIWTSWGRNCTGEDLSPKVAQLLADLGLPQQQAASRCLARMAQGRDLLVVMEDVWDDRIPALFRGEPSATRIAEACGYRLGLIAATAQALKGEPGQRRPVWQGVLDRVKSARDFEGAAKHLQGEAAQDVHSSETDARNLLENLAWGQMNKLWDMADGLVGRKCRPWDHAILAAVMRAMHAGGDRLDMVIEPVRTTRTLLSLVESGLDASDRDSVTAIVQEAYAAEALTACLQSNSSEVLAAALRATAALVKQAADVQHLKDCDELASAVKALISAHPDPEMRKLAQTIIKACDAGTGHLSATLLMGSRHIMTSDLAGPS